MSKSIKPIYLDHAAATPTDKKVLKAMQPYFTEEFYNPSALYLSSRKVAGDIAEARKKIAGHLGSRPAEVIFTAGGTEANNLAIKGVMEKFPDGNILVSCIEHESVLAPSHKYDCRDVPVMPDGIVNLEKLKSMIDDKTVLVSVMYANNEIGTIQPIRQIANTLAELRKRRKNSGNDLPLYLHTDACQAAAYLDLHVAGLGVDLLTLNGGKIYGPKQSGALYVKAGLELAPQTLGGGQEFGMRSGTENVAGIIGLAAALDIVQSRRVKETARMQELQRLFIERLEKKLPDAQINGSRKHCLPNNIHITLPGQDNEKLIFALDESGFQAAAGSACTASSDEPSHVLRCIGLSDDQAQSSLRFTMGKSTTEADIFSVVDELAHITSENK